MTPDPLISFTAARSAIHEIQAALSMLIATVPFGCAGIMYEIKRSREHAPSAALN